jgi:hypothetical protein
MMRNMMTASAAVLGVGLLAAPATAQTPVPGTPYVRIDEDLVNTPQGRYEELPNPTIVFQGQGSSALFSSAQQVQIPFDFKFYDSFEDTFSLGTGGNIVVGQGNTSTFNWAPSDNRNPRGWIAGAWGSHYILAGQAQTRVGAQVFGSPPSRYVALEYRNMTEASSANFGCCDKLLSWQVRLYEGLSGRIEIDFEGQDIGSDGGFLSGTSGMQDQNASRPIEFMPGSPNITHGSWINALDGKRITLIQDPGVELVALTVGTPEFANLGAPVEVPVSLTNLNGRFTPSFEVTIEASRDRNFEDPMDITEVGSTRLQLGPYQTFQGSVVVRFPEALGTNRYFVRMLVDTENDLTEVDETNNVVSSESSVRLLPSRPDLAVTRVSTPVRDAEPGEEVTVNVRLANQGSDTTEDVVVDIKLSTNPAISPQDSTQGTYTVTLQPGEVNERAVSFNLPMELNSGTYYFGAFADADGQFEESNESNNGLATVNPVAVAGGDVAIVTPRIPAAQVGVSYTSFLTAVGGDGDYDWRLEGQTPDTQGNSPCPNPRLPQGVCLDAGTGSFFGNCSEPGEFDITLEARSEGFQAGTRQYTFRCVDPDEPLTIVTRTVPDGIVGKEYAFEVVVTGGNSVDPNNLSFSAMNLPMGLSITDNGFLAGTPVMATGEEGRDVTLQVGDGDATDDQVVNLVVNDNQNLLIDVAELPVAELGESYSAQIEASGGVGDIIFALDSGDLPNGLGLNPDGSITGVPDEVGSFTFVVRASDSPGGGNLRAQDRNEFTLNVVDTSERFRILTESLPTAFLERGYNTVIAAAGGVPELDWSIPENIQLPQGLQALQLEGSQELTISGTPEVAGALNLLVSVTDALDREVAKVFVLNVVDPESLPAPQCPDPTDFRCAELPTEDEDDGCSHTGAGGPFGAASAGVLVLMGAVGAFRRRRSV